MKRFPEIIAIDGPAASGKSTIAELAAKKINYLFFDTGVMYRAVTLAALRVLGGVSDEKAVSKLAGEVIIDARPPSKDDGRLYDVVLDGEDVTWEIRNSAVDRHVSVVSAYPKVRNAMTAQQRRIGCRGKTIVVGRDIGTVVFPDADLKVYLDASVEERARRRYLEIIDRGGDANMDEVLKSLTRRDYIDSTRRCAPLRTASDAIVIDTQGLTVEEVLEQVMRLIEGEGG